MAKADLTAQRLRQLLNYDQPSGVFTWIAQPREGLHGGKRVKIGAVAGNTSLTYRRIRIDGELYLAHRLAWLYVFGKFPDSHLDHINGEKDDNRILNLRETTIRGNSQNLRKAHRDSASGFLGVTWSKHAKMWNAGIKSGGKRIPLGYFKTPEAAHAAYVEAKRRLHSFGTI